MTIEVCPLDELPPGSMKLVPAGSITVGVFNCGGNLYAIEDRCCTTTVRSPRATGTATRARSSVRATARTSTSTGRPLSLPAYVPVETFPVRVEDGVVKIEESDSVETVPLVLTWRPLSRPCREREVGGDGLDLVLGRVAADDRRSG